VFRAVLFDFDFTLGESEEGIVLCANRALAALGHPPASREAIRHTIGLTLEAMFERLTGRNGPAALRFREAFIACADDHMARHTRLYPGVAGMLRGLHRNGRSLGIVTTKRAYRIQEVLERDGIADLLDLVVGIDGVRRPKPAPDGLLLAMERLGTSPQETLYVGDSTVDGEAARAAGVPFAAVLSGATPREELEALSPAAVLDSAVDVQAILEEAGP